MASSRIRDSLLRVFLQERKWARTGRKVSTQPSICLGGTLFSAPVSSRGGGSRVPLCHWLLFYANFDLTLGLTPWPHSELPNHLLELRSIPQLNQQKGLSLLLPLPGVSVRSGKPSALSGMVHIHPLFCVLEILVFSPPPQLISNAISNLHEVFCDLSPQAWLIHPFSVSSLGLWPPPLWGLSHFTVICMPAFSALVNYTFLRPGTGSRSRWAPPWPQHTPCLPNAWQEPVQSESYSLYHSCLSSVPEGMGEHKSNEGSTEPRRFSWTMYVLILASVISVICKHYF